MMYEPGQLAEPEQVKWSLKRSRGDHIPGL